MSFQHFTRLTPIFHIFAPWKQEKGLLHWLLSLCNSPYVKRHAAFAPTVRSWSRVWGRHSPTSGRPCDRTFSSIENLWPQVDTCFRPFRATLKISEVEPQCTLKILQSKTCEKAKPLLMVTVHTERSSCPCFAAALSGSLLRGHRRVSHADGHSVLKGLL